MAHPTTPCQIFNDTCISSFKYSSILRSFPTHWIIHVLYVMTQGPVLILTWLLKMLLAIYVGEHVYATLIFLPLRSLKDRYTVRCDAFFPSSYLNLFAKCVTIALVLSQNWSENHCIFLILIQNSVWLTDLNLFISIYLSI